MSVEAAKPERRSRMWLVLAMVANAAIVSATLLDPLMGQRWWSGFRGYFSYDQLAYGAIASNVSVGASSFVEPYTLTGTSFYPSLWYQSIGLISRVTGLPVHLLWTILGMLVVCAAVLSVGWLAYRLSGRAWAPLLPSLAILTGTLSVPVADYWYSPLGEHAVLWGPFGTLFVLNAEVVGLSLAAVAMTLLVLAARGTSTSPRMRAVQVIAAAAIVGLTANIQTYSFFTASSVAALFIASRTLLARRSRALTLTTVGLVTAVLLIGSLLSAALGPLPIFALLLFALLPAAWPMLHAHLRLAIAAGVVFAALAAPQVLRTAWGLVTGDPFLTYRQGSTQNLGVVYANTVFASVPLILLAIACIFAVARSSDATIKALVIAPLVGLVIMATNDLWGFHQEPYRFWLQYATLALLLLSAVLAWGLAQPLPRPQRAYFLSAAGIFAVAWFVGLADVSGFATFARDQGIVAMDTQQLTAARSMLADKSGDLVMSSKCLTPGILKNATKGRIAAYNKGLAWPTDVKAFEIFTDPGRRAGEDPVALRAAKVRYVLTDSSCADDWSFSPTQNIVPLKKSAYLKDGQPQELTLWWVQPA